jgi:enoyl-CoA hydratase/carnithine racemase
MKSQQHDEPLILRSVAGPVTRLVLNRPEKRNALSLALIDALQSEIREAERDGHTRVLIVAAKGPTFSSGHDLKELTAARGDRDSGAAFFSKIFNRCAVLMQAIVNSPLPVIAEVQGVATAAGCQLVASCDLALAASTARFATPGVSIGLFCSTPAVALSRAVGRKAAMQMLLTGDAISAGEAVRLGLINAAVSRAELESETMKLAQHIASRPANVLGLGKRMFNAQAGLTLDQAYELTARIMAENMLMREAGEGIGAFIEKRAPNWPLD